LHIDKSYLEYSNRNFDMIYLATKLPVHEATSEYVIKINSEKNLNFLADFLFKLYNGVTTDNLTLEK